MLFLQTFLLEIFDNFFKFIFQGLIYLGNVPVSFLNAIMPHVKVFARVSPKQKVIQCLRISKFKKKIFS